MFAKTERAKISALKSGDFVLSHGTIFELTERGEYPPVSGSTLPVIAFKTLVIRVLDAGGMPAHWRNDWTIQSNDLARWTRVSF